MVNRDSIDRTATLERSLELHRNAVVVDFHSGLSNDVVRRRDRGERRVMADVHLPKVRAGGVDAVCVSVGGDTIFYEIYHTDRHLNSCLRRLEAMLAEAEECSDEMTLATTPQDILNCKANGKIAILLGIEGGRPIEERIDLLAFFYRFGIRRFQLTWNFRNNIADGCGEEETAGGLTRFGVEVVREVGRLGMVLDLSHISLASFWSTLKHATGPVIVSHANCYALRPHPRNLRDDQIRAIAQSGGLVGMTFYGTFLTDGPEPTIEHVADHVEHVIEIAGPDYVAIGPDYMDHNEGLQLTGATLSPHLYPPDQVMRYPRGLSTFAETPNLTRELLRRGHSETNIRKVLGENYLRVLGMILRS